MKGSEQSSGAVSRLWEYRGLLLLAMLLLVVYSWATKQALIEVLWL